MKAHHVIQYLPIVEQHNASGISVFAATKETVSSHLLCLGESVFAITLLSMICGGFLLVMYSAIALL
jgi:hypothetical protein